ncbi:hypothetical protein J2S98_004634, partial [Arthrobacter oryzae]|uniref:hypothetical protein n=1 Tax=Arthrobacter oryzae TaxID=409290 RepID=UPI00277F62AF
DRYSLTIARWLTTSPEQRATPENYTTPRDVTRCTESWLRDGATSGRFPHACWGKGKIIFTSEHILEIAKLSEILPGGTGSQLPESQPLTKQRLIGTRSKARLSPVS